MSIRNRYIIVELVILEKPFEIINLSKQDGVSLQIN